MNDVAEIKAKLAESTVPQSSHIINQLRLAISEAISVAARNAVNEQSQFAITVQAATTQTVAQILNLVEAPAEKVSPNVVTENPTAAAAGASSEGAESQLAGNRTDANFPDLQALGSAQDEDFSKAFDALLSSFSRALNTIAHDQLSIANALVKQSLQTAIVLKMVESPESVDAYAKILDKVSEL